MCSQLYFVMYKTQKKLEQLPPLRVPQRPFNQSSNPEIAQLLKESNELLNVCHILVYIAASNRHFMYVCLSVSVMYLFTD